MKISVETKFGKVTIENKEIDDADHNIYDFKEKMLEPLLLGMTYQPQTIAELFGEEFDEG